MSYDDCDRVAEGRFINLKDDGDEITFLIIGEPVSFLSKSNFGPRTRYLFPIECDGELRVWGCGKTDYKELSELKDQFANHSVSVTRHGKARSMKTTYTYSLNPDTDADTKSRGSIVDADVENMFDDMGITD